MSSFDPITNQNAAKWIKENTLPLTPMSVSDWHGNFVAHCVPAVYPAYCKIFHNIYEDISVTDRTMSWDDVYNTKRSQPGDAIDKLVASSVTVYGGDYDPQNLRRLRWQELAEQLGLAFHPELTVDTFTCNFEGRSWPRYLIGPDDGRLDDSTCREIVRSIATTTSDFEVSQRCYFHYDLIATDEWESDLLFEADLRDVFEISGQDQVHGTPTHWWPMDRSWFVCSDWDLTFTLVGASGEIINALMANEELECVRVNEKTRIDYKSDRINPTRYVP